MSLEQDLKDELVSAMKAKDVKRRNAVRQIRTGITTALAESGAPDEADDELVVGVIQRYVKQLAKSQEEYNRLGQGDVAAELAWEAEYLGQWLPSAATPEETQQLVAATIQALGADGEPAKAGMVIGAVMKADHSSLSGALDGRLVAQLVAKQLNQ